MKYSSIILILFIIFFAYGCGKKVWPEPDASQEEFNVSAVSGWIRNSCLIIQAEISGNHRNLRSIILELEKSDKPCPACPFFASSSVFLGPGSPELDRRENILSITHCGLDPEKHYRARIRAANIYPMIRDVLTGVVLIRKNDPGLQQ